MERSTRNFSRPQAIENSTQVKKGSHVCITTKYMNFAHANKIGILLRACNICVIRQIWAANY